MSFKRFSEFAESKAKSIILPSISIENYNEFLVQKFSGSVIKRKEDSVEALRQATLYENLQKSLNEISFPLVESLMISISAHNETKFYENIKYLKNYINNKKITTNIVGLLEDTFLNIQTKNKTAKLKPEDVDNIVENIKSDALSFIETCKAKIETIVSETDWDKHPIHLEALICDDYFCNRVKVFLGEQFQASFEILKENDEFKIENLEFQELPASMLNQFKNLIDNFKNKYKSKNILTLYLHQPKELREFLQQKKRTLALGETFELAKNTFLTNMILSTQKDEDLWKVKIFRENLSISLIEGDFLNFKTVDECKVLHLELVKEGRNEE